MARRRRDEETAPLRRSVDRREGAQQMLNQRGGVPQFTFRATLVGLLVGTLVCFSNMYFGLQTGWVSMMSMPSSLIGFTIFKALRKSLGSPFTPIENVLVQTVAVAAGSMPLSAGFVGVIPALEKLLRVEEGGPLNFSVFQLIVWSMGVAFFGVFFAVPLRKQFIIKEKLKFPSGTATALMIFILHGKESDMPSRARYEPIIAQGLDEPAFDVQRAGVNTSWESKRKILIYSFAISGVYTLLTYFFPLLRDLPVFGSSLATTWLWTLNPSPAYIGQGIIMGTSTTLHMFLGAIVGWGLLSPLAKNSGWAPGPVSDWKEGVRGWIVWVSLAVMLVDSIISLGVLVYDPARNAATHLMGNKTGYQAVSNIADPSSHTRQPRQGREPGTSRRHTEQHAPGVTGDEDLPNVDYPPHHQVSNEVATMGLLLSGMLCITTISIVFDQIPLYSIIIAFLLALVLSLMGVRALGQTDLNPVSGISKLTQLIFALIVPASNPNAVIVNLVAGAVSEAGAQQAGDIMQDLKTGHLIGAAPRAQFYGQLIGSAVGAIVSAVVYRLYNSVYKIPSKLFQVPTAYIWIDCSRLVFGQGLPPYARGFASLFALVFTITTFTKLALKNRPFVSSLIPGGIAFAVGMYNVPSFTLARVAGGLLEWAWRRYLQGKYGETPLVILASGLILGEGLMSIVNLAMASFGVPCWGP